MKFLKRYNEGISDNIKEDILDNFQSITDLFGKPTIVSSKFGSALKWTIVWHLPFNITHLQDAKVLIGKLHSLMGDIDDIISASERLGGWDFRMSLSHELRIEMVPKDSGKSGFKFIKGFESRTLLVDKSEIERFLTGRGLSVSKWDLDGNYDEWTQRNDLDITISGEDMDSIGELSRMIEVELERISDIMNEREYVVRIGRNYLSIEAYSEKSLIDLV